jgi:glutathione S-transferase
MAWLSNTVHTTFGHILRTARYADDPAAQEAIKAKAKTMYEAQLREIDGLLAGRKWAIGEHYTVVDGYLLVFYRWGNRQGMPVGEMKNYTALVNRVLARKAVQKVMADEGITMS